MSDFIMLSLFIILTLSMMGLTKWSSSIVDKESERS